MPAPATVILYVSELPRSVTFWTELLGAAPVESSPGFALFLTPTGLQLGLWPAAHVAPAPSAPGGGELTITVPDAGTVDDTHADWASRGWVILQPPTDMDFGHTFTAADPDGHRVRVFSPAAM